MTTELSPSEREEVANALSREADRLDALLTEYKQVRNRTRTTAMREMADEGAANMKDRSAKLRALVTRLRAKPANP